MSKRACTKHRGERWLPEGKRHGLRITHKPTKGGVPLTHGGKKVVLHTTEGANFDVMDRVLRDKHAEPHFLIGRKDGVFHVIQYFPLNVGARALEHPAGTKPTNGGGDAVVQIEIAGFAVDPAHGRKDFDEGVYQALYRLIAMIQNRVAIPSRRPRRFRVQSNRFDQDGFIKASGIVGHGHAASQFGGHWDPGAIRGSHLVDLLKADPDHIKEC